MKTFYERYSLCDPKVQRAVALLPWSYNILLINKKLDDNSILYYAEESVKKGWNRVSRWDRYLGMTAAMTQVPLTFAPDYR